MVYREVTFTLDKDDYKRLFVRSFTQLAVPASVRKRRRLVTRLAAVALGAGALAALAFIVGTTPLWFFWSRIMPPWFVVAMVLVLLIPIGLPALVIRRSSRITAHRHGGGQPMTVRLCDNGVEVIGALSRAITPWQSIAEVEEDAWAVYLGRSGRAMCMVPRRAFGSTADAGPFAELARRLTREAWSEPPAPFRSTSATAAIRFTLDDKSAFDVFAALFQRRPALNAVRCFAIFDAIISIVVVVSLIIYAAIMMPITARQPGVMILVFLMFMLMPLFGLFFGRRSISFPNVLFSAYLPMREPVTVLLDESGIIQQAQGSETTYSWRAVTSIDVDKHLVQFVFESRPALVYVPVSAFASPEELAYFVAVAKAFDESAKTLAPPRLPPPATWPPPPGTR